MTIWVFGNEDNLALNQNKLWHKIIQNKIEIGQNTEIVTTKETSNT